jgi:hypothetical protein
VGSNPSFCLFKDWLVNLTTDLNVSFSRISRLTLRLAPGTAKHQRIFSLVPYRYLVMRVNFPVKHASLCVTHVWALQDLVGEVDSKKEVVTRNVLEADRYPPFNAKVRRQSHFLSPDLPICCRYILSKLHCCKYVQVREFAKSGTRDVIG